MECGGCTSCCTLLPVEWMDSPAGEACAECDPGVGCRIFSEADPRCRSFACMYRQMPECGDELRPDRCGVVFEKLDEGMVYGTIDPVLGMGQAANQQTAGFQAQGFSVVLDDRRRRKLIVAPGPGLSSAEVVHAFRRLRDARFGGG